MAKQSVDELLELTRENLAKSKQPLGPAFGFKKALMQGLHSADFRQEVFSNLAKITALLRTASSDYPEKEKELLDPFPSVASADELEAYALKKPKQFSNRSSRQFMGSIDVYGSFDLNEAQKKSIKLFNAGGKNPIKHGKFNQISSLSDLFHYSETRKRRIYILGSEDPLIQKQVSIFLRWNPQYEDCVFCVEFNGNTVTSIKPFKDTNKRFDLAEIDDGQLAELAKWVYHRPQVGEIFNGRVEFIGSETSSIYVKLVPGHSGILREVPAGTLLKKGDPLTVKVVKLATGNPGERDDMLEYVPANSPELDQAMFRDLNTKLITG